MKNKMSMRYWKRKFSSKNFIKYFMTGILFTGLSTILIWIFVDYIVLFPKKFNTPLATFLITVILFVLRYLVFQWIGFTHQDELEE